MGQKLFYQQIVRCVKCGFVGRLTGHELPASPDARSRWSKFGELLTCPSCGDDGGHCGVLEFNGDRVFHPLQNSDPLTLPANHDRLIHQVQQHLSPDQALKLLMQVRGYDADLAQWLVNRRVGVGVYRKVARQVPDIATLNIPRTIKNEPSFWLPIVFYFNGEPAVVGFQLRAISTDTVPRYASLRFVDGLPLIHFALPEPDKNNGKRYPAIVLSEGWFKAEIATYKLGVPAIGLLGTGQVNRAVNAIVDAVLKWSDQANLFSASIVLAPDADARTKISVASSWWRLTQALQANGIFPRFVIWDGRFKGIDDALLAGEPIDLNDTIDETVWLASLSTQVREKLLKVKVRPRILLDREIAQTLPLQITPSPTISASSNLYDGDHRKQVWLDGLNDLVKQGRKVLVDMSPTGSGKTKAVAGLKLKDLRKVGLPIKRLVYIAPEIKRPAVNELQRWHRWLGRDETCQFWDRLNEAENEGLSKVGRRVCAFCPIKFQCEHYRQQRNKNRYLRVSWQSYKPKAGDLIIFDEFSRLPLWRDCELGANDVKGLMAWLQANFGQNPNATALTGRFNGLLAKLSSGEKIEGVAEWLSSGLRNELSWLKSELEQNNGAIIKAVRDWIFGQSVAKPQTRWRFLPLVDILLGNVVGSVWVEQSTLKVRWLDAKLKETVGKAAGILILDATANPNEIERLLSEKPEIVSSDEPQAYPTTIQVPLGALTHRASRAKKELHLRLAWWAIKNLQAKGLLPKDGKVGVLTHKDAADIAQRVFGKDAVIGWWGRDERATNAFYEAGVQILVAVGLPHRNLTAIAAEHGKVDDRRKTLRLGQLDGQNWVVLKEFTDWELAEKVRHEVAVAYLQAAGRLRQGRRAERCFFVVCDAEPLPVELRPQILPPEKALPAEILNEWLAKQKRGMLKAQQAATEIKRKVKAERLHKVAQAVSVWQRILPDQPLPTGWLTKATGVDRRTLWKWGWECNKPSPSIRVKDKGERENPILRKLTATLCCTDDPDLNPVAAFALHYYCPPTDFKVALALFWLLKYPIPIRAIARQFKVDASKVSRHARTPYRLIATLVPACPQCGEKLYVLPPTDGKFSLLCEKCHRFFQFGENGELIYMRDRVTPYRFQPSDPPYAICPECKKPMVWVDGCWLCHNHPQHFVNENGCIELAISPDLVAEFVPRCLRLVDGKVCDGTIAWNTEFKTLVTGICQVCGQGYSLKPFYLSPELSQKPDPLIEPDPPTCPYCGCSGDEVALIDGRWLCVGCGHWFEGGVT